MPFVNSKAIFEKKRFNKLATRSETEILNKSDVARLLQFWGYEATTQETMWYENNESKPQKLNMKFWHDKGYQI